MLILFVSADFTPLLAEGSKDFVDDEGCRMYLDTRDPQQLKVYANEGEVINVGASHIDIAAGATGYILVITPSGDTALYLNEVDSDFTGLIQNSTQEANGPTGGGALMGAGYTPATVAVGAGQTGIWTVIFNFEEAYQDISVANYNNICDDTWDQSDQPQEPNVILSWDITVSQNGAGNDLNSDLLEGRVYTNEYISVIRGYLDSASPTFYVLTNDGFQYEVEVNEAFPFRFEFSSNSLGLVNGDLTPIYESRAEGTFTRSGDVSGWLPGTTYLYDPQAPDVGPLVNNKVFFNPPNDDMPGTASVADFEDGNVELFDTWLYTPPVSLEIDTTYLLGFDEGGQPCSGSNILFEKGGFFYFETNIGGSITLQLDLNGDGDFDDDVDLTLMDVLNDGLDSVFWNGTNGLGDTLQVQDSLVINYGGSIQFGEIHIALADVEHINGGISFDLYNSPDDPTNLMQPDSFFYDHSPVFADPAAVSGGGTPGNALPDIASFTFPLPAGSTQGQAQSGPGNNNYLDHWYFLRRDIPQTQLVINIVTECPCANGIPDITAQVVENCENGPLTLTATNSTAGVGDLTYEWTSTTGFSFTDPGVGEGETSTANVSPSATLADAGTYSVVATSAEGCFDSVAIDVTIIPAPEINSITGGGNYCPGDDITLSATNTSAGPADVTNYTWTFPDGSTQDGSVTGSDPITATINDVDEGDEGTVTLTVSVNGCPDVSFTTEIIVDPVPVLTTDDPNVAVCENGDITICATNTTAGIASMECTWSGPNGFSEVSTIGGDDQICITLTNVDNSFEGTYTVSCDNGCPSASLDINLDVQPTPEINGISPSGDFCVGDDVMFTAQNVTLGTGDINYVWVGPAGDTVFSGSGPELGPFPYPLTNVQLSDAGTYTLILSTTAGCESVPQTTTISVIPAPIVCDVTGGGEACVGQTVTLSAFNCASDVLPVTWTWTGPSGSILATDMSNNDGPYEYVIPAAQLSDSGTYCITISNVNCPQGDEVCIDLNVNSGLSLEDPTPDSTYCEGSDVLLTANTTVGSGTVTYTWFNPDGTTFCGPLTVNFDEPLSCTIDDITEAQAGTYSLTATSSAGCDSDTLEVFVGVFPTAMITLVEGGGDYCSDDDVVLNGTGIGSSVSVEYTWTSPSGDTVGGPISVSVSGPFPGLDTTPEDGTYTLTVTTPDGCVDTETVEVNLGCTPIAEILTGDTTLCEGDTLLLCGQNLNPDCGIIDYTWLTPNSIPINGSANGTEVFCDELLPLSTYGSGTYQLLINSGNCQSVAATVEITLNPNPIISTVTGGGTYCTGDTAIVCFEQLNPAIDSFFYTCNIGTTQVTNVGATGDVICLEITESTFIFCSIESFDGCVSALNGTEVIFDSGFDLDVTSNGPVCSNETLELNGNNTAACTGDADYQWINPNGDVIFTGTAPCEGPFPASDDNPISGEYCLIVSSQTSSCSDTACVDVTVDPAPEVTVGIDGGGAFCEGESTTLTATVEKDGGGEIDYVWTLDGVAIDSGTVNSGDMVTLEVGPLGIDDGGEYCLELTCPDNGCTNDPPSCTTVSVEKQPDITDIQGAGTYCEGDDVSLTASGTPGPGDVTYTWEGPNYTFTGTAPCGGPYDATIENIQQDQAGEYTLTVSSGGAAGVVCVAEETITIDVNPKPIVTLEVPPLACEGEEITITATIDPNNATSVDWALDGPGLNESGTVTELTTLTFTVIANEGDTYTLSATSDQDCVADEATGTVTTTTIPTPPISVSSNPLCPGDPLQLTTEEVAGTEVAYCWFLNGELLGTTDDPIFDVSNPQAGDYTVQVKVDGCDATSDPATVTIVPTPDAVDDNYSTLADTPVSGNVTDNDTPSTGVTATITEEPSNGSVVMNPDGSFTYTPNPGFVGTDQFSYEICSDECTELCDPAIVTIVIDPTECEVPNIITPNGDGTNDVLFIACIPPEDPNNSLRVFNRWGDEIFSAEPYMNDWDGNVDGDPVPAATYFYLFYPDRNDQSEVLAGYIKVVR